jgi:hypothetical protein
MLLTYGDFYIMPVMHIGRAKPAFENRSCQRSMGYANY